MASYNFRAFGLRVESDAFIEGLPAADAAAPAELRIRMGSLPDAFHPVDPPTREVWHSEPTPNDDSDALALHATSDGEWLMLRYADGTRFVLRRSGAEIWATWPATASAASTATYLLGPVVGFALRLRGLTCFHASSVVISNRAILMMGPAGIGKSSTAAALALRGHRVLGDDIAVVRPESDHWVVCPSIPGVRLWDDMVESLLGRPDALPLLAPGWEKRHLDLRTSRAGFQPDAVVPLGAIYLLSPPAPAPSSKPVTEHLRARDALLALVANTYANVLLTAPLRRAEFVVLSSLVRDVPVWRVGVPASPGGLEDFCARIAAAGPATEFGPGPA